MRSVREDWLRALGDELNNNILMNSPKGRSAYVAGIAYALQRLEPDCDPDAYRALFDEALAFMDRFVVGGETP